MSESFKADYASFKYFTSLLDKHPEKFSELIRKISQRRQPNNFTPSELRLSFNRTEPLITHEIFHVNEQNSKRYFA